MPTLQDELARRRALTDVSTQYSPDMAGLGQSLTANRNNFLTSNLAPTLSSYGLNQNPMSLASINPGVKSLVSEQERSLASKLRNSKTDMLSKQYENAVRRAEEAGLSHEASIAYGQQVYQQNIRNQFVAEQNQADMQSKLNIEKEGDVYNSNINDLQNSYLSSPDYMGALYRGLFGLGTSAVTYGLLNRQKTPKLQNPIQQFPEGQGPTYSPVAGTRNLYFNPNPNFPYRPSYTAGIGQGAYRRFDTQPIYGDYGGGIY